ncbi:MAG: hypothetical protein E6I92_04390 [Chloroflexi bacterium]|nr:MAG: hypothetical protein E6I92_04390 [Chloroflexota bacterium]
MIGDLEKAGDRWRLRFRRELRHPVGRVWKALTEPDELRRWFPDQVHVDEWKVGSKMQFKDANARIEPFEGEVLAYDPPSVLEFRWGTDVIRFEVAPRGEGCVLTLTDTIDEVGKAAGVVWPSRAVRQEVRAGGVDHRPARGLERNGIVSCVRGASRRRPASLHPLGVAARPPRCDGGRRGPALRAYELHRVDRRPPDVAGAALPAVAPQRRPAFSRDPGGVRVRRSDEHAVAGGRAQGVGQGDEVGGSVSRFPDDAGSIV